jgi:hypothetical protein
LAAVLAASAAAASAYAPWRFSYFIVRAVAKRSAAMAAGNLESQIHTVEFEPMEEATDALLPRSRSPPIEAWFMQNLKVSHENLDTENGRF